MHYFDGSAVALGDVVSVPVPGGNAEARVVMLGGETYEHLDIDVQFLSWVKAEKKLDSSSVVVEWIASNPFAHNNASCAPVGNYLFLPIDQCVKRVP